MRVEDILKSPGKCRAKADSWAQRVREKGRRRGHAPGTVRSARCTLTSAFARVG